MADQVSETITGALAQCPTTERRYALAEMMDSTPEVTIARFDLEDGEPMAFDSGMLGMLSGVDAASKKYAAKALSIASDPSAEDPEFVKIINERYNLGVAQCSYFYDFAAPGKYSYIGIATDRPKDQIIKATSVMNRFVKNFRG